MAKSGHLHHNAKLNDDIVEDIVWRYKDGGNTYLSLSIEYDVGVGTISKILRGQTWRHITGGVPVTAPLKPLATHCSQEHEFTPENTRLETRKGRTKLVRKCRKCDNARHNAAKKRKRAKY